MPKVKKSPMMLQYDAIKKENPDCFLFFRMGDFYELFGEDAKEAAQLLNITLTARGIGEGRAIKIPMCGVPYHAAPNYIQKLLKVGRKVAICEQFGDPKKGPLKRELVRIVTPGTTLEDALLQGGSNNYVVCIYADKKGIGLAAADNTTGEFICTRFETLDFEPLAAELERLNPAEILLPDSGLPKEITQILDERRAVSSPLESWAFSADESQRVLLEHFEVASLESFGLHADDPGVACAGALLSYLQRTQRSPLSHIVRLQDYRPGVFMQLDANTLRHLELVSNQEDGGKAGTLLEVLDRTVTAAGARLLRRWICSPLKDKQAIENRLEAVAELSQQSQRRETLHVHLSGVTDIERILGRVGCLAAHARDLAALRSALQRVPLVQTELKKAKAKSLLQIANAEVFSDLKEELEKALVEEPPLLLRDGGLFRLGYSKELDVLIHDSQGGKTLILEIQSRERKKTGIATLKVQFNNIFGYYIEVSKRFSEKIPEEYERKQTLVNTERYSTPELKALEERVLQAEARRKVLEETLFKQLVNKIAKKSDGLLTLAASMAKADVYGSLAAAAVDLNYVRPTINDGEKLELHEGRHPVIEYLNQKKGLDPFVSNDTLLDTQGQQIMLITGPNMAGKSTYMRQVALMTLMAQMGSFVPAVSAEVGLVDRIFTRIGASDRLSRGMSTFLVEMIETAHILNQATRKSLVILDEIGRGTSTFDGISIAWAVAEHLHESKKLGCRALFATHYFELTELARVYARIENHCVAVREWNGKIVFLHQIQEGSSEHSYGVAVARLAGVPPEVLKRAKQVLQKLESQQEIQSNKMGQSTTALPQLDLFSLGTPAPVDPRLEETAASLKKQDLNQTTPLQALELLQALQKSLTS